MHTTKRNLQARVVYLLQNDPSKMEEIFALTDVKAASTAFAMSNLFMQAIGSDLRLNVPQAVQLVQQQSDMVLYQTIDQSFSRNDIIVEALVIDITNYLTNQINVAVSEILKNQIRAAITDVFVNLNIQKEDAWIFWAKESGHQTTYRYNILFAIQNEQTGPYVFGLPLAFTITIAREYERVLFITIKDSITLTVRMEGLKAGKLLPSAVLNAARKVLQLQD